MRTRPFGSRSIFLGSLLLLVIVTGAHGQAQLTAGVDDPALYTVLEICSIRGLLPPLSAVKPYRIGVVERLLRAAREPGGGLSWEERAVLERLAEGLGGQGSEGSRWEGAVETELRANLGAPSALHTVNRGQAALKGSLASVLSYDLNLAVFLDRVDPEAFVPYAYTKEWDGFHIWAGDDGAVLVSDGTGDHPGISFSTLPQLSLDLWEGKVNLQLSRVRHEWGVGEGSLSLSGTARPIEALSGSAHAASGRWSFHFLTGTLGNWWQPEAEQKMLSIHRLEWFPFDWLYLAPWESVVWAKRFELSYLNPIMSYFMGQQLIGDLDNVAFGAETAITFRPVLRLYFSLFLDEVVLTPLDRLFTRPNNQFAWQAGVKIPIPWIPLSLFILQYTKIEPYCYTHYPQELSTYTEPVNINFTNDGENIGYHLPPNSDELLLRAFSSPVPGLTVTAQYQLIRHGTGDHLAGQIEGDIDTPIVYAEIDLYPEKDFLHDGIYEWINVLTLNVGYSFAALPLKAWVEYSFVHENNGSNVPGNTVVKNLVGLGLSASWPRAKQRDTLGDVSGAGAAAR